MAIKNKASSPNAAEVAAILLNREKLKAQTKHIQVISDELMQALHQACELNQTDLDEEVITRLISTLIEPNAFGFSPALDHVIGKKAADSQIKLEKQYNREAWDRLFELEKLELYLRMQPKMSKTYKENFLVIDVTTEAKRIHAMLAEEQRREEGQTE